ncbi:MAG TPA: amidohydrolase family protein [Arthrobacter sp.]|nr:amidohydrolase family protein [Arthrobacter sp.]
MPEIIEFSGVALTGPEEERRGLWSVDGRLTFVRPDGAPSAILDGWVLPGLVDAHCHVGLGKGGAVDEETARVQAATDRNAGTLLIRDAGSASDTRWLQHRPDMPRIIRAGRHLARKGRYIRGLAEEVEPEGLVEAVRKQARFGDGWVKIVGDWIDRSVGDLGPSFPAAVVKDAVAAAHDEGARVTAHCFAEQTIDDVLDARIDCIEHATGLLPRHIPRLLDQGVPIVPTLVNIATFPDIVQQAAPKFPLYAGHMAALWERRYERVREAHEAGIRIYAGTDAGSVIKHGRIGEEILELHRAGLPPAAALDSACWSARNWLGADGISEGSSADVVLYAKDPRASLDVVLNPQTVVLRGSVVDKVVDEE